MTTTNPKSKIQNLKSIGVLGGGQLGRMLALAGYPLGLRFRCLDPSPDACAGHVAEHLAGGYEDPAMLERFAEGLDVVTYEFENVPVETARLLSRRVAVYPPPTALEAAQDRLTEKSFFRQHGIPTPPFLPVGTREELRKALRTLGTPAVLKTRRFGYDGKGQAVIESTADAETAWASLGGKPLILEGFMPFDRELSILAVRARDGEMAFYPLVENHHRGGILRLSIAPAPNVSNAMQATAEGYARRVMEALDYVGVLAIELFEVGGELLANEMAPRVHNSGHWTIEAAETSQFENHLRAITGLPIGSTASRGYSAMLNIIGDFPDIEEVLRVPNTHLHLYGKEPRPGRKIGHVTLRVDDSGSLAAGIQRLRTIVGLLDSLSDTC
ncbi:MAG: 5-(carboxyamino)imidazole ribonucleotide synthase [Chloroflexota bacterium]|nr:5-(carboxyamino)imidazole ribonucleotide synthase [Chloroflexota bacterium]MDQ5864999.1 5-(carboxyamino)imidazole ribonucleotide synthase [Chloroflexota bacterium]